MLFDVGRRSLGQHASREIGPLVQPQVSSRQRVAGWPVGNDVQPHWLVVMRCILRGVERG